MTFASSAFLFALAAGLGPVIIHLLNRQRYQNVDWAAMQFLLQAVSSRRRRVQIRDLLLLLLRTLAIIFFVLAMARPIWTSESASSTLSQPVHLVLLIDNSLSMAYVPLDQSYLERAQTKASDVIREMPSGSQVSILPMCPSGESTFAELHESKEDALDALQRIDCVDRAVRLDVAFDQVRQALRIPGTAPTKRVVVLSDMQESTWASHVDLDDPEELGSVQYVAIRSSADETDANSWVEQIALRNGYAETGIPAAFDAVVRHEGREERKQVKATLKVAGAIVDSKMIDLVPGQKTRVSFEHVFNAHGEPVNPSYVPVRVSIDGDKLAQDDERFLMAPVFERAPILFIDQHGDFEDPSRNLFGESFPLRLLYQSRMASKRINQDQRSVARAISIDSLTDEHLHDARLVVLAGVSEPTIDAAKRLTSFVKGGGQLLITAGGEFNPEGWTNAAWNDGEGILPVALRSEQPGTVSSNEATSRSFRLDPDSLNREIFELHLGKSEWHSLVTSPFFYRAVRVASRGSIDTPPTSGDEPSNLDASDIASKSAARVIGRFDNNEPFAIHKRIGDGNVVLVTTSCFPTWNNLAVSPNGGILLYDQLLHWLLSQSVKSRTFEERQEFVLSIDRRDQGAEYQLVSSADSQPTPLAVEAAGSDTFAVVARGIDHRSVFEIRRVKTADATPGVSPRIGFAFAVNGPSEESHLRAMDHEELATLESPVIAHDEVISLKSGNDVHHDLWGILMGLAIGCLLLEMLVASGLLVRRASVKGVAV